MFRGLRALTVAVAAASFIPQAPTQTVEIRGVTMDSDRAPLSNVEIQIRKFDQVPIVRTRSAADGRFRVPGLTPGTYRIIATIGDRLAVHEGLALPPASLVNVSLHLERPTACRLARVEGTGGVRGRIVDWLGEPAPAFVWLEADDRARDRRLSSRLDGHYEIDVVAAGRYRLHVWVPALEPVILAIDIAAGETAVANVRLELPPPKIQARNRGDANTDRDGSLSLTPPPLATGFGGISGVVTDTGGGVIPGATVTVQTGAGRTIQVITNRSGVFWLPNLAPGRYEVRVSLSGFKTSLNTLLVGGGRWTSGATTLEIGEITPHEKAVKWMLKWSESLVGIRTALGEITLALPRNEFLACVERGAYTGGRLEGVAATSFGPLFRLVHGTDKPAAPDAPAYGLRLGDRPDLVVLDPVSAAGPVEGRVVDGFDIIDRLREWLKSNPEGTTLEIVSIGRLVLL